MLQQVTKQLNYKQQKDNEAVRGSQYFFFFQIRSCQTHLTCLSDRLTVLGGQEKSANTYILVLNTAFDVLQMTFSQAN